MLDYEVFQKPRLRVAALTPGLSTGGAEIWLATLFRHAQTVKYTSLLSFGYSPQHLSSMFGNIPIEIVDKGEADLMAETALKFIPANGGADLIMYWGIDPMPSLLKLGVPVVHVSHSSATEISPRATHPEFVHRFGKSSANFIAAVSYSSSLLFDQSLRQRDDVTVIHNGADVERTRPAFGRDWQRQRWKIDQNAKVLLYVGRFSEEKGPDLLLEAMPKLPDDWHLVMVGWGPMEAELKARAKNLLPRPEKSISRIIFPQPRLTGLGDFYAAADVVVLPSFSEAFPLVMVEAWHAGIPLVCANFRTLEEIESVYNLGNPLAWHIGCPPTGAEIAESVQLADRDDKRVEDAAQIAFEHLSATAMVARWESYFYKCVADWHQIGQDGLLQISLPSD